MSEKLVYDVKLLYEKRVQVAVPIEAVRLGSLPVEEHILLEARRFNQIGPSNLVDWQFKPAVPAVSAD